MQQQVKQNEIYKHYIALDWSKKNFALASIRDYGTSFKVKEYPPDLKILKQCLMDLSGRKILTIEETTTAHWLYVELKDYVDKILICEPHYNRQRRIIWQVRKNLIYSSGKLVVNAT